MHACLIDDRTACKTQIEIDLRCAIGGGYERRATDGRSGLSAPQNQNVHASAMQEERKECLIEQTKDGTIHTLFSLMILLKKNKDIKIISKLIFKITDKMKE